jgi:hypothetical protein
MAKPANTVGIPRTTPDNTDVPPRCSIYAFEEETIIKNDICRIRCAPDRFLVEESELTCRRRFEVMMITKEDVFGSLNSGSPVVCDCASSIAVRRLRNMLPIMVINEP